MKLEITNDHSRCRTVVHYDVLVSCENEFAAEEVKGELGLWYAGSWGFHLSVQKKYGSSIFVVHLSFRNQTEATPMAERLYDEISDLGEFEVTVKTVTTTTESKDFEWRKT